MATINSINNSRIPALKSVRFPNSEIRLEVSSKSKLKPTNIKY